MKRLGWRLTRQVRRYGTIFRQWHRTVTMWELGVPVQRDRFCVTMGWPQKG